MWIIQRKIKQNWKNSSFYPMNMRWFVWMTDGWSANFNHCFKIWRIETQNICLEDIIIRWLCTYFARISTHFDRCPAAVTDVVLSLSEKKPELTELVSMCAWFLAFVISDHWNIQANTQFFLVCSWIYFLSLFWSLAYRP